MKKISVILAIGFIFYSPSIYLTANVDTNSFYFNDDDDFDFDDFGSSSDLNISKDDLLKYIPPVQKRSITSNTNDWANALLALQLSGNEIILNQSLYQRTNPIRTRTILDYPFALTYGFDAQGKNIASLDLYANIAWPKNFTQSSQFLSSYLNTENQDILDILDNITEQFMIENALDFGETFALLSPGKVVEIRAGGLLQTHFSRDKWNINLQLPVQYVARAFYLTPAEKDLLMNSPLASSFETENNISESQFYYENFFVDQLGIGDFKIKAMYQVQQSPHFDVNIGGFIILPVATAIQKGVIGTWLEQNNNRAYLDLRTINPDGSVPLTGKNQDDITNFFMGAINKLNSNILYPLLGNNGHVVTAFSCNTDWYFAQNWKFCGDYSFEIPLRAHEQRFYKAVQSNTDFENQFNTLANNYNTSFDDSDANALVLFANQKIQDMFFPFVYNTLVWPGLIVNSTNQFVVSHDYWGVQFGSNFWYQAKEQITAPIAPRNYDISVVPASSAAQGKVFGKFNYNFDCQNNSWSLSAYTDITVWNSGIGNDYTICISLDCKF
ncbi:hypothetical protein [Candidatus Chromulinivorax destructor]|uniref:Uncharacterized protein n=1 Tax=Candidatus Chromulinivorax destructor TaxID=2066483 RepID=A0A345ZBB8_9BACT|nr:hypothetical protein [Candidatus Chromulinivorax destructor]AXK60585.1 hypothetical protein C0J27_02400 [Candidatus Chromulinivorax destructor]